MGAEWNGRRLGDITEWTSGGTPSKSNDSYWNGDIPWISASSMDGSRYRDSKLKITPQGLDNGSRLAPAGSVLLLVRGSILHQKIQVGIAECDVAFNQDVKAIRVKEGEISPWFLLYWFMAKRQELLNLVENTGIGAGKLDTKVLQDLIINIPPKDERDWIVELAKALDDKIELNRQMNTTLEAMAQALFKSWFVDFDPVIDNALAAGNPVPEALQKRAEARKALGQQRKPLPEAIQKQFPDRFVFNDDLGWVPEGWQVVVSGEVMDVRDGTHDSPKQSETGYPLITSRHITSGKLRLNDAYLISSEDYEQVNKRSKVEHGDILLTMIGTVGVPCLVMLQEVNFAIKNIGLFRTSQSELHRYFFYFLLKMRGMKKYLEARMAGTTQRYLSLKVLRNIEFLLPNDTLLSVFNGQVEKFMQQQQNREEEVNTLISIRDTLLPKLISGELRVPDAIKQVGAAL